MSRRAGACQGAAHVGDEGSRRRPIYLKAGCRANQKAALAADSGGKRYFSAVNHIPGD
jgi:hypothetical protein